MRAVWKTWIKPHVLAPWKQMGSWLRFLRIIRVRRDQEIISQMDHVEQITETDSLLLCWSQEKTEPHRKLHLIPRGRKKSEPPGRREGRAWENTEEAERQRVPGEESLHCHSSSYRPYTETSLTRSVTKEYPSALLSTSLGESAQQKSTLKPIQKTYIRMKVYNICKWRKKRK